MGALEIVNVERTTDPELVVREAQYDTYEDDHPKVLDEDDPTQAGDEYLDMPEVKGAVNFDVELAAFGFTAGEKVQLDAFTAGGYRTQDLIEPPTGDVDEPATFHWSFGPVANQDLGTLHILALQ